MVAAAGWACSSLQNVIWTNKTWLQRRVSKQCCRCSSFPLRLFALKAATAVMYLFPLSAPPTLDLNTSLLRILNWRQFLQSQSPLSPWLGPEEIWDLAKPRVGCNRRSNVCGSCRCCGSTLPYLLFNSFVSIDRVVVVGFGKRHLKAYCCWVSGWHSKKNHRGTEGRCVKGFGRCILENPRVFAYYLHRFCFHMRLVSSLL